MSASGTNLTVTAAARCSKPLLLTHSLVVVCRHWLSFTSVGSAAAQLFVARTRIDIGCFALTLCVSRFAYALAGAFFSVSGFPVWWTSQSCLLL